MGRHHHRIALALIAASSLGALPARAQDAAQAAFDEGVEHLRAERFREAARAFRASYREAPRVEAMCNLALTYDRWGDHLDPALRAYRTCARDDASGRYRGFAERRSAELERELALAEEAEPEPGAEPAPEPEPEVAPAPPPPAPDHAALFVGLGAGGAGLATLGVAIGLALSSGAIADDLARQLGPSPTVVRGSPEHARLEDARAQAGAATALYVAAGVLLAASAALVVVDLVLTQGPRGERVAIVPLGPGAALHCRF